MSIKGQNKETRSGLSQDELAKTQVLNLDDVEKTARFERYTSKKPAFIMASVGIFAIMLGLIYNPVVNMMVKDKAKKDSSIRARVEEKKVKEEVEKIKKVNCEIIKKANSDGTDSKIVYDFTFDTEKLQSYSRNYSIIPTDENSELKTSIPTVWYEAYKALEPGDSIPGYKQTSTPNDKGLTIMINVDLLQYNNDLLPDANKNNENLKVEFTKDQAMKDIITNLEQQNYTCK